MTPARDAALETIHVVLAVYDPKETYSRHVGVVTASIFENTQNPVRSHILHDETLTAENRHKLLATARQYGQEIDFVDVTEHRDRLDKAAVALVQNACSIGTLYRLFIPDVLHLERVIYLDSDVVVDLDIRELWDIPLEGNSLAGVLDHSHKKSTRIFSHEAIRARLLGCRLPSYVNAGVLLMDLDRIRKHGDFFSTAMNWLAHHRHSATLADQDILNALFCGDIKLIDNRFNNRDLDGDTKGSIMHAIREPKPWTGLRGIPLEKLYWRTYLKTPWGADLAPSDAASLMIDLAGALPQNHRRSAQCYRRIGERLWRDILCNDLFSVAWLLLREAFYRALGLLRRSDHIRPQR